jgi:hypothetical protein
MDRDTMRTMVRDLARIEAHDVDDTQLDVYLDEGYQEVVSNRDWPWCYALTPITQALTADIDEYALAATVIRVLAVRNDDQDYPLEAIAQSDWARLKTITADTTPRFYTFTNGTLHIWPPPSTADDLIIEHYEHPLFDTGDNDSPVYDAAFHQLLVDWSLSRLWEMEEDFEKADDYRSRFEIRLLRMAQFYNTLVEARPLIYGGRRRIEPAPLTGAWFAEVGLGT